MRGNDEHQPTGGARLARVRETPPAWLNALRAEIRRRGYSIRTEQAHESWVARYLAFIGDADPCGLGNAEGRAFLQHLAVERLVTASTQNQALNALVFFSQQVLQQPLGDLDGFVQAKRPQRRRVMLTRAAVGKLLEHMHGTHGLMAALLYGTSMRLMDCIRLRVKDIDFAYHQIVVRDGKEQKDRVVSLPQHFTTVKSLHQADLERAVVVPPPVSWGLFHARRAELFIMPTPEVEVLARNTISTTLRTYCSSDTPSVASCGKTTSVRK